jgi:NAD(P)-dependent dehydrogenase (short-subunit alcohol dehydrogenase family)
MATPADLAETVKEVEALDRRIFAVQADVRDYAALKAALDDGVAQLGGLDIVSANAGIASFAPAADLEEATWQDMIDVNLTGVWHAAKAAIPHLIAGGRGGSIVLTSSTAGLVALPNMAHYVAAKHGVVGLMRTLALELAPHSIRVNSVHPTGVNSLPGVAGCGWHGNGRDGGSRVDACERQPDDEPGDLFELPSAVQRSQNGRDGARVPHELAHGAQRCRVVAAHRHGDRRLIA